MQFQLKALKVKSTKLPYISGYQATTEELFFLPVTSSPFTMRSHITDVFTDMSCTTIGVSVQVRETSLPCSTTTEWTLRGPDSSRMVGISVCAISLLINTMIMNVNVSDYWGEPERAPYWSNSVPRDVFMYMYHTPFSKCPRVLIHWTASILLSI